MNLGIKPRQTSDGEIRQHRLWEGFVRSNPLRVLNVLALGFRDNPSPVEDTLVDFYPALAAVEKAAIEKDQHWQNLVDLGVAEVLCLNVISFKMKKYLQSLPSGSQDIQKIPSSTFLPMNALVQASLKFSFPASGVDMKVIAALKKYWSMMVLRLLKDPENSLRPGEPFDDERTLPARLFSRIMLSDPSFTCVLDNERDYTIQLISRYWSHATSHSDIALNNIFLTDFIDGETGAITAYKNSHPFNPSVHVRILQGALNVGKFISAFASHLDLYDGYEAFMEVSFLDRFWMIAATEKHPLHSDIINTHRKSLQLWTSICSLMRRTANDKRPLENGYTVEGHTGVIVPLIHHVASAIGHCANEGSVKDCLDLIRCCIAADLFGTLDIVIRFYACGTRFLTSEFLTVISAFFVAIKVILRNAQTLAPILRSQFPRARSFRTLVDLSRRFDQAPLTGDTDDDMPPPSWITIRKIERACILEDECTLRDCDKKRTGKCTACKKVGYCSVHCQRRDWQEHKMVCKLEIDGEL